MDVVPAFLNRYARRYLLVYGFGIAFLVATNWLTVTIPTLIKEVFDSLAVGRDNAQVQLYCALIGAAALAVIVVRTLSRVLFFNPGRTIEFRLRNDMLQRLLAMSATWLRGQQTGDLVSRAINDATFVRSLVGFAVLQLLNVGTATAFAFYKMLRTDAWLTMYCMVPLLVAFFVLRQGTRKLYRAFIATQQELGALSKQILEAYNGVSAIQAMVAEDAFQRRFDEHNDNYTRLHLEVTALRVFVLPLASAMGHVCVFLLLIVGGRHAMDGHLSIGDIAAYASYAGILVGGLAMFGWVLNSIQRGYVALRRCWEIAELESDRPAGDLQLARAGEGLAVRAEGLTYRYPDAGEDEEDALSDVSFTIAAGETLGVYGPVGSGKSTLINVISGILPPPPGTVSVGGHEVRAIAADDLRATIAVVPQQAFLFSRTLRENIALVDDADHVDDERVRRAVDKACLAGEVERFADGLNTVVGEKGLTLSGGQRQRAQLARAFYRGYRLLLLDDVLSAVDHDTEERLLASIEAELSGSGGRPSGVIVSSRISALAGSDRIIVLDGGRVVERGTHAELIARPGLYAEAFEAQRDEDEARKRRRMANAG